MIELNILGRGSLQLEHLVCDVNGTLAVDGKLIEGLVRPLTGLRDRLNLHLITADLHGGQALIDRQLGLRAIRIQPGNEDLQKEDFVRSLDAERVIAIGQGANDARMLKIAGLGIGILSPEGLAAETLLAADLVLPNISAALELIENPIRIVASLRR
jgi:soluble P-type ATPase